MNQTIFVINMMKILKVFRCFVFMNDTVKTILRWQTFLNDTHQRTRTAPIRQSHSHLVSNLASNMGFKLSFYN